MQKQSAHCPCVEMFFFGSASEFVVASCPDACASVAPELLILSYISTINPIRARLNIIIISEEMYKDIKTRIYAQSPMDLDIFSGVPVAFFLELSEMSFCVSLLLIIISIGSVNKDFFYGVKLEINSQKMINIDMILV